MAASKDLMTRLRESRKHRAEAAADLKECVQRNTNGNGNGNGNGTPTEAHKAVASAPVEREEWEEPDEYRRMALEARVRRREQATAVKQTCNAVKNARDTAFMDRERLAERLSEDAAKA